MPLGYVVVSACQNTALQRRAAPSFSIYFRHQPSLTWEALPNASLPDAVQSRQQHDLATQLSV